MGRYDAIVIGAGHNGLTAAAVLADAGRRVLVLERSGSAGGMMAPGDIDGVTVPRLAHLLYNVNPAVARDLGLDLDLAPLPTVSLAPDGRHVMIEGGAVRFADGTPHPDAAAFAMLHARLVRFGSLLGQLSDAAPPDPEVERMKEEEAARLKQEATVPSSAPEPETHPTPSLPGPAATPRPKPVAVPRNRTCGLG